MIHTVRLNELDIKEAIRRHLQEQGLVPTFDVEIRLGNNTRSPKRKLASARALTSLFGKQIKCVTRDDFSCAS